MAEELWFDSRQKQKIFLFSSVPSGFKHSIQRVRAVLSVAVQGPKHEGDRSPPSNVEVKNEGAPYLHFLICITVYTWTTLLFFYLHMHVKTPALNGRLFHSLHLLVQRRQRSGQGQMLRCCEHN